MADGELVVPGRDGAVAFREGELLGYAGVRLLAGVHAAVCIDVVPVPEPKTATRNRVHLDLATTSAAHQAELDWILHEVTDDHAALRSAKGVGPYLEFLRTPGVKTVPDRVHLDLLPYPGDDKAAEVARLRAVGATDLDLGQGDVPVDVPVGRPGGPRVLRLASS